MIFFISKIKMCVEELKMKKDLNGYIGVFDSGLGGISVLKEMVKLLPHEKFYFYGDSARAPYGERSLKEVQDYTMETMNNMVNHGVKAIVVACNTATSAAIEMVRDVFTDIIVIGVEPALKPAAEANDGEILVMATENTLRLDKYHELAKTYGNHVNVKEVACNGLAQAIETGDVDGEEVRVVRYVDAPNGKKRLMTKREMNRELGHGRSMDLLDVCAMRMMPLLNYQDGYELENSRKEYERYNEDEENGDRVDIYDETTWY